MREPFNEFDIRTYGADDSPFARHSSLVTRHLKFYKGGGAPAPESYYSQMKGELQAKAELAPTVYATEAQFDPLYAGLNNQILEQMLFGNPASTQTISTPGYDSAVQNYNDSLAAYNQAITRGMRGNGISGATGTRFNVGNGRGGNIFNIPAPIAPSMSPTTTVNMPASRGIIGLANDIGTSQRTANIADWSKLSPDALDAIKKSNPQLANLIDTMMSQSQSELNLGGNLNPAMMRQVQQTIRGRQNGMLTGTGNAGDYGEALGISQFGQNLRQQRLGNAATVAGISSGYYTPQLNDLMYRTYNPYGGLSAGMRQTVGPRLFGSDINAQQVNSDRSNAAISAYNAKQNNSAAMESAGISAGAGLASAALLAAFM